MMQPDEQRAGNLRKLLEQHWVHCRHLESERAWFLNVYGIVTGGTLAYVARGYLASGSVTPSPLFYFLIVLAFFGFFHTLRWTYAFECHREKVNELIRIMQSKPGVEPELDLTMDVPPMDIMPSFTKKDKEKEKEKKKEGEREKQKPPRKGVNEIFRTRYWFPLFYFIILVGFAIFFSTDSALSRGVAITASVLAFLALALGFRWYFSLRKIKEKISLKN